MNEAGDSFSDDGEKELPKEVVAIMGHLDAMAQYIQRNTGARSVQIHITKDRPDGDGCERYAGGRGNIYERIGACSEWLNTV